MVFFELGEPIASVSVEESGRSISAGFRMRDLFISWVAFSLTMGLSAITTQYDSPQSKSWIHDNHYRLDLYRCENYYGLNAVTPEPDVSASYAGGCDFLFPRPVAPIGVQKLLSYGTS